MLSAGSWIWRSLVSVEDSGIAAPSSVADAVMLSSAPTAHARSSSSVVPLPSNVLHSVVQPENRILVPRWTVQLICA
jgi:hypothetical protein